MMEEELILNRMLKGTDAAVALHYFYQRYSRSLFVFLFLLFRKDQEKARDLVQETFLRAFERRSGFDPDKPFRPWLFRIALNLCRNEFRRMDVVKKNQREILWSYENEDANPVDPEKIWEAVNQLSFEHQQVILLRYRNELPVSEISEILGCPEGTVKSRIFYAVKDLSKRVHSEHSEFDKK